MKLKLFTEEDAKRYLSRLAKDAKVPEPKLVISDEPFRNLPSDVDWDCPAFYSRKERAIYIRPKDLSPAVIAHEFAHYLADIKGERERMRMGEFGDMAVLMDLSHVCLPSLWHIQILYLAFQIRKGMRKLKSLLKRSKEP